MARALLSSLAGASQLVQGPRMLSARALQPQPAVLPVCSMVDATHSRELARLVQNRISVAASTGRLDVSDCGLKELPPEVFELKDLVELSCSGNEINSLPDAIGNLCKLKRLSLSANKLKELPATLGRLQDLEGLWAHGNMLHELPRQIGELQQLRQLALAGNRLTALPDTISELINLEILSVAGNGIKELPTNIGTLKSLRVLAAFGNLLSSVPDSLTNLTSLQDLWLQSNLLEELPRDWGGLCALKQLSLADNLLRNLPDSIGNLAALEQVWLYSNKLSDLPKSLGNLKKLSSAWLENNPLKADGLKNLLPEVQHLRTMGISSDLGFSRYEVPNISISHLAGTGAAPTCGGYFKLHPHVDCALKSGQADILVVAFGSAPGVPNWCGVLKKVKASLRKTGILPMFDILLVVDSARSWYTHDHLAQNLNGGSRLGSYYRNELKEAVKDYRNVIMLGDSMGASAALLFSDLATVVLAFCPQVDLTTSSIRPGRDQQWLNAFTEELVSAVLSSSADIRVHCGSWPNDIEQAKLLPSSKVKLMMHDVDDHRLAKELDSRGQLVPAVQCKIEEALSFSQQETLL